MGILHLTSADLRREVDRLMRENGCYVTVIEKRDGSRSWLTRRLDGLEIYSPPTYSGLAGALKALTEPRDAS